METERKFVDWEKTAKNLRLLRRDDLALRRFVCRALRVKRGECEGEDCKNCKFEMDHSISQAELAEVFCVSENIVVNWENNKSRPSLDDLLFYCQICGKDLFEVVVLKK
ncbi:MAG: helix-turn-helix transcriptional regulator [Clostridia bacterium]|nr:helix-turn-helix transcriptional regulator [Clostridia bacterium]